MKKSKEKITPESVAAEKRPKHETYWELFEERRHLENIVNTRFNFFLIMFGIVMASLFTLKTKEQFLLVLIAGTIIEFALTLTIVRAERKLIFYLKLIRDLPNHAERAANSFANSDKTFFLLRKSYHRILGYVLPVVICIALIISIFFYKKVYKIIASTNSEDKASIELYFNNELQESYFYSDTNKAIQIKIINTTNNNNANSVVDTTQR